LERRYPLPEEAVTERTQQESHALLSVGDLVKYFEERAGLFTLTGGGSAQVKAVDGVSLELGQGLTLGLVGESGCGKTTIARCIVGLTESTAGTIVFGEHDISRPVDKRDRSLLREIQMVFQNPDSTLNPRQTVGYAIGRALRMLRRNDETGTDDRIVELLRAVRLGESYKDRYPGQLSGGEKQRVAIARAFAGQPRLVVCDEPISSLDVSVQASIVNLLLELQNTLGTSYLFISHDLSVVRYLADYIGVIYLGRLCEVGSAEAVFAPPYHPYTEALLSAIPIPDPKALQKRIRLEGPVPSAINPPLGCHVHTRCPRKIGEICETEEPPCVETEDGLRIFCHIPLGELYKLEPVTQA
jgi:peptide/nickel transport system ATP-binding protein